ncbi:FGGY-family carbohydrate kinase [Flagellimonas allohymeniacidonis]|uniref:Carbohydrate kinase n=1 Tax=Flagellimonas allohymeniacidonis TaxID=2517819 RepID=A0A4Q8QD37_9FLAO|nr:FGGY family carbohydrate kinase [Allomuricauda hymeniacidonis]TAI48362.1 carbohydrate kinase [Allomuricauda hymeniacidonis]
MTSKKVTAVFDIGKTNKKFFLFDANYQEVYKEYIQIEEVMDEDGVPTEDLPALQTWIIDLFDRILDKEEYAISGINFSSYGASLVHLDKHGKVLTPLYNYLKPIPQQILDEFYILYGKPSEVALETASPQSGMLNSGLQLFWLKRSKPEVFKKIKYSLHLPQYLSYLFTGIPLSEYTSIGCHTNLWNFQKQDYHHWVYAEGIDQLLPPIVSTQTSINLNYKGKPLIIGVGIHDSSSALLPYLLAERRPFLLLSTGTWSIVMNPFTEDALTEEDLEQNCLAYMRIDGNPVRASRFFMGNEYKAQTKHLNEYYKKPEGYHRQIKFEMGLYQKLQTFKGPFFRFEGIKLKREYVEKTDLSKFATYEEAYHQLMIELLVLQFETIERAIGNTKIKKIYIDGGFTDNDIFVKLLAHHFEHYKVRTTQSPLGSALGAAMVLGNQRLDKSFFKDHYLMKKLMPLQAFTDS